MSINISSIAGTEAQAVIQKPNPELAVSREASSIALAQKSLNDFSESQEDLDVAVQTVNQALGDFDVRASVKVDKTLDIQVVSLVDDESGDVLLQLPTKQIIHAAKNIEQLKGIFVDHAS